MILEKLLTQENRVLEYWTSKKKRLDQNQQFCLFERSARQSLAWIKEEGDIYLSTHTRVGANREETERLLREHNSFKVSGFFFSRCFSPLPTKSAISLWDQARSVGVLEGGRRVLPRFGPVTSYSPDAPSPSSPRFSVGWIGWRRRFPLPLSSQTGRSMSGGRRKREKKLVIPFLLVGFFPPWL